MVKPSQKHFATRAHANAFTMTLIEKGKMPYTGEDLGVYLLETITLGLYRNPFNAIREYITNEKDAEPPAQRVDIRLAPPSIYIQGDGGGMDWDEVQVAKQVGISHKDPKKHSGFRGIGIFSGIAVCRRVIVETMRENGDERIILTIDAEAIRREVLEGSSRPIIEVLHENVEYERHTVDPETDAPGTIVELREVLPEHKKLLDEEEFKRYLELTAPVDFHSSFVYRDEVSKYLRKYVPEYTNLEVTLKGDPIQRRPSFGKDKLHPPRFYEFKTGGATHAVWWVCLSKKKGIKDTQERNLIYKRHGITVGERNALDHLITANANLLNWMVGEIHVIDPRVKPAAERVAFEPGKERDALEAWLARTWENVKNIPREISSEQSYLKRKKRLKELSAIDIEYESDDEWIRVLQELQDVHNGLRRDSKDPHLRADYKKEAKALITNANSRRQEATQAYKKWNAEQVRLEAEARAEADRLAREAGVIEEMGSAGESAEGEAVQQYGEGADLGELLVGEPSRLTLDPDILEAAETLVEETGTRLSFTEGELKVLRAAVLAYATLAEEIGKDKLVSYCARVESLFNEDLFVEG